MNSLRNSSPTLSMLKFLNIVLSPINLKKIAYRYPLPKACKKLITFLLSFILRFVKWLPHNLNEEAFKVLNSILNIVRFHLKYKHIEAISLALLDKYTMRSKIHKEILRTFLNVILDQEEYENFNVYQNENIYIQDFIEFQSKRGIEQTSDQDKVDFLEKVNLFNQLIETMDDQHANLFDLIVRNKTLYNFLGSLI